MNVNKVFCLFEQSGTFKNEFIKLGINAEDYDILNEFGETDQVIDLFSEINKAYDGKESLFDRVEENDLVFAFFPCTRFSTRVPLNSRCEGSQFKRYTELQKLQYTMKVNEEIQEMYALVCKLFSISLRGGWKMIVENPFSYEHYLVRYFPIKPRIIDNDRRKNGDWFKKPTQYWFINCAPEENVLFEPLNYVKQYTIENIQDRPNKNIRPVVARSMINNQYANRFIRTYILGENKSD